MLLCKKELDDFNKVIIFVESFKLNEMTKVKRIKTKIRVLFMKIIVRVKYEYKIFISNNFSEDQVLIIFNTTVVYRASFAHTVIESVPTK